MKPLFFLLLTIILFQAISFGQESVLDKSLKTDSLNLSTHNSDSIITNFISSSTNFIKLDTSFLNITLDSVKKTFIKKLLSFDVSGNAMIGDDYGMLSGYIDTTRQGIVNVFRSSADLSVEVLQLPFNVSYNYSTLRNPLGASNYFRISLDKDRINQRLEEEKQKKIGAIDSKIENLGDQKNKLTGKLGYSEVLLAKLNKEMGSMEGNLKKQSQELDKSKVEELNYTQAIDTNVSYENDSLIDARNAKSKYDSLNTQYQKLNDEYQKKKDLYDTLNKVYTKIIDLYETYSKWEKQLETQKQKLDTYSNLTSVDGITDVASDSLNGRKESFLSGIKTLDIGLTYPQTSSLSKNSAPIKGLNFEYEHKNWYYALAAGVTLNNIMVSTDMIENKLTYSQNLFNQFDFQQVQQKGFIVSVKSGYGKKEGQHAFIGFRYLTNSKFDNYNNGDSTIIPSVGLEIDVRLIPKFSKNTTIDLVYGKTSSSQSVYEGSRANVFESMFSSDRTNTSLLSVKQTFKKLKSEVTGSFRLIDPLADMRSLGVLQPNNIRYDLKTKHRITSRLNLGFNYRFDRNNIDNREKSTAKVNVVGVQLGGKIGTFLNFSGNANYLNQNLINENGTSVRTNNYIYGLNISSMFKIEETKNMASFSYNDYLITDTISTGSYRNIGIQNATIFTKAKNTFSVNYFQASPSVGQSLIAIIIGDEFFYTRKKLNITAGIKVAFSEQYRPSLGGKLEVTTQLTKFMDLTVRAEKFVLGDFYNSYNRAGFDRFPYLISTQLNFKINKNG
jgi:hypothetical protein